MPAFALQIFQLAVAFARGEPEPGQIEEYREIAQLTVGEEPGTRLQLVARHLAAALVEELAITRPHVHRPSPVDRKQAGQEELALGRRPLRCLLARHFDPRIARAVRDLRNL